MFGIAHVQEGLDHWLVRRAPILKRLVAVLFGLYWAVAGFLKFQPGLPDTLVGLIQDAGQSQPAWLAPWFDFWASATASNPAFWVYFTGVLELGVAFSLIFGFMRKIGYTGGLFLSLFIWAVPEGFGQPYAPGATDLGGGIAFAVFFLALIVLDANTPRTPWTLDSWLIRRFPAWRRISTIEAEAVPVDPVR